MILSIDTSKGDLIEVVLKKGGKVVARKTFPARRAQAERLLPAIERLLRGKKIGLDKITKIRVADDGEAAGFTSLRIGVVTANALAYALGVPVQAASGKKGKSAKGIKVVEPKYNREPNITMKRLTPNCPSCG